MSESGERIKKCHVCDSKQEQGLTIFDKFICQKCELAFVNTLPSDENYEYYKERLSRILYETRS